MSSPRWIPLSVVCGGMVVMVVEFVGQRMLSVEWGNTTATWGATISVVLGAMALGYAGGGRLADRRPCPSTLALAMTASAALLLIVALVGRPGLSALAQIIEDPRLGSLVGSALLMSLPIGVLALVSPLAVRLSVGATHLGDVPDLTGDSDASVDESQTLDGNVVDLMDEHNVARSESTSSQDGHGVGRSSGDVYALGTFGSIAGSLLAAFYLLTAFESPAVLGLSAIALLVCASGLSIGPVRWALFGAALVSTVLTVRLDVPAVAVGSVDRTGSRVVDHVRSRYHDIVVTQSPAGVRRLSFGRDGKLVQTQFDVRNPDRIVAGYVRQSTAAFCTGDPSRTLVIGLGGGIFVRAIRRWNRAASVDTVEIDPAVLSLARRWFALLDGDGVRHWVMDGRRFVRTTDERYGLVMLDAYGVDSIPVHLLTREFMAELAERLTETGAVVANVASRDGKLAADAFETMRAVFGSASAVRAPNTGNVIIQAPAATDDSQCLRSVERRLGLNGGELDQPPARLSNGRVLTDARPARR